MRGEFTVKHHYFVSYSAGLSNGFAFGNTDVTLDHPIRTYDDVNKIAAAIQARYPENHSVTVLNWLRYEAAES